LWPRDPSPLPGETPHHRCPLRRCWESAGGRKWLSRLRRCGFGSRSPANCLIHELVVGQVAIESINYPVTVGPDARAITVRFRNLWCPHSAPGPATAKPSVRHSAARPASDPLVFRKHWRCVCQVRPLLPRGGRQTGKVQRHTPQEGCLIGFGSGFQPFLLQPRQNKLIHGLAHPSSALHLRQGRDTGGTKRPIILPLGALLDPATEQGYLLGRQRRP